MLSRPCGAGTKRLAVAEATDWLPRLRKKGVGDIAAAAAEDSVRAVSARGRRQRGALSTQREWLHQPTLPRVRAVDDPTTTCRIVRSQGSRGIVLRAITVPRQSCRDFGPYCRRHLKAPALEVLPVGADLFDDRSLSSSSGSVSASTPMRSSSSISGSVSASTPVKEFMEVAMSVRPEWEVKAVEGALTNDIFWAPYSV